MRSLYSIVAELESAVEALPDLDKDDIESRLSDIESDLRSLLDHHVEELPGKVEEIIEAVHDLYTEV